ncbi:MAG: hypothetical protein ACD_2C00193G0017 [uncultured bacterium (gcode 4)]|uniref:Uncharacterized protein n=1 Tax=uncultured bacterium (gcode 4) TaxID=1234023 RepID=K2FDU1_9BACT|nr:MAG: hypothetical protein ACD_2C00193G0017 [uncultured bacterium (gcode 4)]
MFKKNSEFTEAEKIDYIFSKMRKQAKISAALAAFKIIVFGGIIYFYFMIIPSLDIDKLANDYLIPKMSKIVEMTAEKTLQNVNTDVLTGNESQLQEIINWTTQSWTSQAKRKNIQKVNITPEMIEEVLK